METNVGCGLKKRILRKLIVRCSETSKLGRSYPCRASSLGPAEDQNLESQKEGTLAKCCNHGGMTVDIPAGRGAG